jgi:hypothetical protein
VALAAVRPADARFACELGLVNGPNDIEVEVRSGTAVLGLSRFRVQVARDPLGEFLAEVKATNRSIRVRGEDLAERIEQDMARVREQRASERTLEIAVDPTGSEPEATPGTRNPE